MSLKSRLLRLLLIFLGVALLAGYLVFSKLLFNPFEGGLDADVAALVPRQVDFYVSKSGVAALFDGFPRLKAMDELEGSRAWKTWIDSPEYEEFAKQSGLERARAQLDQLVERLPPGVQPQNLFGGRDLAVAGTFHGQDLAQADWAVYGTVNWMGKLAVALLRYPGLLGLEAQGISVRKEDDWVVLNGGGLPRELCVARIRDVVIVSNQPDMVRAALDLRARSYQDSLHQSAPYFDHIQNAARNADRDEIEVALDVRSMLEQLKISGAWPDARSPDLVPALCGKYFQLGALKTVHGVIGADEGLLVDLHGELSSELVSPVQRRLLRTRGVDRQTLLGEAAAFAPADACLFAYLRADVGDLLRQVVLSLEPATRDLIEDTFRNTGRYSSLDQLIEELDGSFKDRIAIVVRPNDYPDDPTGPPHTDDPVFTVAVVTWHQDREKVEDLRELIGQNGARFGLQGREPGTPGYFKNDVEGGFRVYEFWSQFVPGTGMIAMTTTNLGGGVTVVANSFQMLGHILKTFTQGGPRYPQLGQDGRFLGLVNSSLAHANMVVYVDPRAAAETLRRQARRSAEDAVRIDWKAERARVEAKIVRDRFPGQRPGALPPDVQAQVDALVEPELKALRDRVYAEQVPAIVARRERLIALSEAVPGALLMLALDQKSLDLSLRVPVDLAPAPEQ
jgi:hypothetical protein